MSESENKPKNKRYRPKSKNKSSGQNNKNRSQNRNNNKQNAAGPNGPNKKSNSKRRPNSSRNNNRKKFYRNKKKNTQKLTGEDYIAAKYFNLLDQHLNARKKYFENFNLVDKKTQEKLERNFVESQKTFLAFKNRLNEKDKKLYEDKFENLKLDTTYSKNHQISPTEHLEIEIDSNEIKDPHYLVSQEQSDFSEDTEESIGSLDDYKMYKGLQ